MVKNSAMCQGSEREKAESLQLLRTDQAGADSHQLMGRGNRKRKKRKFFDDANGGARREEGEGGADEEEGEWEDRRNGSRSPSDTSRSDPCRPGTYFHILK